MTTRYLTNVSNSDTAAWQSTIPITSIGHGTNNQTLRTVGTTPTWVTTANRYMFATINFTSLQNWNSGATTSLTFDNINQQASNSTGTPAFTPISTTGVAPFSFFTANGSGFNFYKFDFSCTLNQSAPANTSQVSVRLVVNGVADSLPRLYSTVGGTVTTISGTIIRGLLAGQTVGFQADRLSGTDTLLANVGSCNVIVTLVDTCV